MIDDEEMLAKNNGEIIEFALRYNIQNMSLDHDVRAVEHLGQTVNVMGKSSMVKIDIPHSDLVHLARNDQAYTKLLIQGMEERILRDSCPALNAAYEQYQMLLKLAK